MDIFNPQPPKSSFKLSGERVALIIGGIIIGALGIWFGLKMATPIVKKACQAILENPEKAIREPRVVSVEATVLKPGSISRRVTTVGKLHANESVTIRAEMQGRIKEIAFKEGTLVKKDDVLIRFEDEELQAEVVKAEAEIEYRQARFDRMVSLQAKGLQKGPEFDQERGQLNVAKAQLDVAKARLAKATIYAPFDGKIGLIQDVSVGAIVDAQKELVTLVDSDPMKIAFKVPEKFIHAIGAGQTAIVTLDSIPDETFQATVEAVDSRVDPQTHSIAVRATIPNENGKLHAGLFASVGVIIGVKTDALILPESALGREGDIEYVWVVTNGKSGRKRVLTGTKENGQVEIIAGLRPGEIIVTSGQLKLGEGTAVKVSNMEDESLEVAEEEDDGSEPAQKPAAPETAKKEAAKSGEEKVGAKPEDPDKKETPTPSPAEKAENKPSGPGETVKPAFLEPTPSSAPENGSPPAPATDLEKTPTKDEAEQPKTASLERPSETDKSVQTSNPSFLTKARNFVTNMVTGKKEN